MIKYEEKYYFNRCKKKLNKLICYVIKNLDKFGIKGIYFNII